MDESDSFAKVDTTTTGRDYFKNLKE
jgi:hypothetical protein